MVNQELLAYIKKKIGKGSSDEEIKQILIDTGWKEEAIEETFDFLKTAEGPRTEIPEPPQEMPEPYEMPELREMLEPREIPPAISPSPEPIKITDSKRPLPWKKILIGVVCFLLVGGAVFGGYYYYSRRPLLIIGQALDKIPEIKSFRSENELKIQVNDKILETLKQGAELESLNSEYSLGLKAGIDFINPNDIKLSVEVSSGEAITAEFNFVHNGLYGKLIKTGPNLAPYFKPGDLEEVEAVYEIIKSVLTGRWIKISESGSSQFAPDQAVIEKICQSIKNHPEVMKKITKTIGSDTAYGYKIEIDKNEVAVLLADLAGQGTELEPIKEFIDQNLNINNLEIWIGKKTYLIEKLSVDFSLDIKGLGLMETGEAQILSVQYDGSFTNHNQALAIQAPETFSVPEEILEEYNSAIQNSPLYQQALKDREIISGMETLKEAAIAFKTQTGSFVNFEKTSSFVTPWRAINSRGGAPLVMYYLPEKFCIQKELLSSRYYCVDYTGYSGNDADCDQTNCDCKK